MDETACNYDENATIQAFGDGMLSITVSGGSWLENFVDSNGVTYGAPASSSQPVHTPLSGRPYGDGWNGGEMTVVDLGSGIRHLLSRAEARIEVTGASTCTCQSDLVDCEGNSL